MQSLHELWSLSNPFFTAALDTIGEELATDARSNEDERRTLPWVSACVPPEHARYYYCPTTYPWMPAVRARARTGE